MVLKTRRPDRRHFKSRIRETRRREREYYYAAVSVFIVKLVLLVFLGILFSVTASLFPSRFRDGPFLAKYGLPMLVLAFIVVLLVYIWRNYKELRELGRKRREKSPTPRE